MPGRKTTVTPKKLSVTVQAAILTVVGTIMGALITGLFGLAEKNNTPSFPTDTPTIIPTSTPNPTATPTYVSILGPQNGALKHDGNGGVEWKMAGTSVKNFIAEATFINPYSASDHRWDINIFFRRDKDVLYRAGVQSEGKWSYGVELPQWKSLKNDSTFDVTYFDFRTEKGESNSIRVIAYETTGCLYLNNKFLGELDLSNINKPGDIAVAIGSYSNSETSDATTIYQDFSIYRLNDFSGCP